MTVSLPASWVKKHALQKGAELSVEEHGSELRVNVQHTAPTKQKELSITGLKRVGKSSLTSLYRQGYDEIIFHYEDPSYLEIIQELVSKELIGFEIIKHAAKSCTIKDLGGHTVDEFSNALRRIWLLLLDLARESREVVQNPSPTQVKNIEIMDRTINKFSNYCIRTLTKRSTFEETEKILYYHLIRSLEKIGDQYKDLCLAQQKLRSPHESFLVLFDELTNHLQALYVSFYKTDLRVLESLFEANKLIYQKIVSRSEPQSSHLGVVTREIKDLLSLNIELNLH